MDLKNLLKGDRRAIAQAITEVENKPKNAVAIRKAILPHTGRAHTIGITGPPGSGKSTIAGELALEFCKARSKVGIIAIDSSSSMSGGAFMGNRVRMARTYDNPGVYIRSMASRGSLGGICAAASDAVNILDAAGMQYVIIETVGAGQSQTDIVKIADTVIVVFQPETGDAIQASKAGLMEVGDIFVVNKSDLPGADSTLQDLTSARLQPADSSGWKPIVVKTCMMGRTTGLSKLRKAIEEHRRYLKLNGRTRRKDASAIKWELLDAVERSLMAKFLAKVDFAKFEQVLDDVISKKMNVSDAATKLAKTVI